MLLLSLIGSILLIMISYIVGIWTKKSKYDQQNSNYYHLFYGFILIYLLVIFLRSIWVYLSNMLASKSLHELMVYKVLRAPIKFFDSTPIGRILTRLAQDIIAFDFSLPNIWSLVLNNWFRVFIVLVLMSISVPYVSILGVACLIINYIIRRVSINPQNDLKRFDSITKAPINTKFGSAIDGVTTIRVYNREEFFTKSFMNDLDTNANLLFTYQGVVRWAQWRLDISSLILIFLNSFLIVILKNYTDSLDLVLASISLQFSVDYGVTMSYLVRVIGELENFMTRSQRWVEYAEMETEDDLTKNRKLLVCFLNGRDRKNFSRGLDKRVIKINIRISLKLKYFILKQPTIGFLIDFLNHLFTSERLF